LTLRLPSRSTDDTEPDLAINTTAPLGATLAKGDKTAQIAFPAITATDFVTVTPMITCEGAFVGGKLEYTPGSSSNVALFTVGTTEVRCTAVDEAGNSSPARNFTVTVCAVGVSFVKGACIGRWPIGSWSGRTVNQPPGNDDDGNVFCT
jgi:hypothetical protein